MVCFSLQVAVHYQGRPRQELEVGTWKQEVKQSAWRNAAFWLASVFRRSYPSYTAQTDLPRDGTTHSSLGFPTSKSAIKTIDTSTGRLLEAVLQLIAPFSSIIKLTTFTDLWQDHRVSDSHYSPLVVRPSLSIPW